MNVTFEGRGSRGTSMTDGKTLPEGCETIARDQLLEANDRQKKRLELNFQVVYGISANPYLEEFG